MGIQIGPYTIAYYGLCIAIGVLIAGVVGYALVKKYKLNVNDFFIMAAMAALGGIVGAKLLYILVSIDQIDWSRITEAKYLSAIMSGGFVFYGGLIGGLLTLILCKKWLKIQISEYIKYCMPCLPLVHGIGRIGCSLAGCCYGAPYEGACAITYHDSLVAPNGVSLFPVQAVEACANIIIAIILTIYIIKNKTGKLYSLPLYLLLYAPVRFILEYFRYDYDERGFMGAFSTSQWISIGLVVGVIAWLIVQFYRNKNKEKEA